MSQEFENLKMRPELHQVIRELGFTALTPVQAESIPPLLEGRDLVGQSRTGSGKTLAFTLPLLHRLDFSARLQALILCPTRELSDQVAREVRKLGRRLPHLKVVSLVGGQPFPPQAEGLRRGAHIAVGTPGRVLDHLRRGSLFTDEITYLVLDEADRMLDMGFAEEMQEVMSSLPENRQTVFFSATFPGTIEEMSAAYQKDPVWVKISEEEKLGPGIRQLAVKAEIHERVDALLGAIEEFKPETAIVFCNLKATVHELYEELSNANLSVEALHGDLDQNDRDRIMAKFRNGSVRVLVATDVAARGIDIADLPLVVNFEMPKPDIYVHRIGRTGRAGKGGLAVSFYAKGEEYKLNLAEKKTGQEIELGEAHAPSRAPAIVPVPAAEAKMITLFIGGGRKDKMRPGDILGALTGEAGGLAGKDVGKIEIHDRFSYVAVAREVADVALEALRNGKIKGRKFRCEKVL